MRLLILVLFSLLLACRNNPHSQVTPAQTKDLPARGDTAGSDTTRAATGGGGEGRFDTADYTLHTRTLLHEYSVSLWQCAAAIHSACPPVLVIRNTRTQRGDTLALTQISDLQGRHADFEDITRTAGFRQLTLMVSWEGEDDNQFSEVVGYQQDTLKEFFAIPNAGGISDSLRRKDQWTLEGHVFDRDDVVAASHDNYLIRVSLKDYSVKVLPPDTLAIDYETRSKERIHAYRVLASGKKVPFMIPAGARVHIDTLYYKQQIVHLRLDDSIRLTVPHDEIQFKVNGETAG
ncbi:MAG: hypothetical protein Q8932_05805 [Bacteroidota bacterium]|nr:hypothetical protein [Bacteroidota bacterium]